MTAMTAAQLERRRAQQELATRIAVVTGTAIALVTLTLLVVLLVSVRSTTGRIFDCTDAEGECYRRGQEATAMAVASINDVVVAAATCASQPGVAGETEMRKCIADLIADGTP